MGKVVPHAHTVTPLITSAEHTQNIARSFLGVGVGVSVSFTYYFRFCLSVKSGGMTAWVSGHGSFALSEASPLRWRILREKSLSLLLWGQRSLLALCCCKGC